jgi:predicted metalloendopeptidase
VFAISIVIAQNVGAGERAGLAVAAGWGFDLAGADFRNNPGDDFFRHANGAWYDRALIPADRSSIGVDTVLNITAETRIRGILERGEDSKIVSKALSYGASSMGSPDELEAQRIDTTGSQCSAILSCEFVQPADVADCHDISPSRPH